MKFWKEHVGLRVWFIALFFAVGMCLVIGGWKMTGDLMGLFLMVIGLSLIHISEPTRRP